MTALVGARRRDDGGQGDRAVAARARCSRPRRAATRSRRHRPGGRSRTRRTGGTRPRRRSGEVAEGRDVAGIGLSGQMHGLVALDSGDRVIRPAILWNDQRTAAECAEIESRIGAERLVELTGNRALTGFTAPKLLWLRRHEPDAYARIARVMLPKDYVRLRLTGEWATDASDASGTLLLDVGRRAWSRRRARGARPPRRLAAARPRVARSRGSRHRRQHTGTRRPGRGRRG